MMKKIFFFLLLFVPLEVWGAEINKVKNSGYKVVEDNNRLFFNFPWGDKVLVSHPPLAAFPHYQLRFSLDRLKQSGQGASENNSEEKGQENASNEAQDSGEDTDLEEMIAWANELYGQERFGEAENIVRQVLLRNPDHKRGLLMQGSLYFIRHEKDAAKAVWTRASEKYPNDPEIKNVLKTLQ